MVYLSQYGLNVEYLFTALMFINATLTPRNYRSPERHPHLCNEYEERSAWWNKFECTNENRCNLRYNEVGCARYGPKFACESPSAHNNSRARVIGI